MYGELTHLWIITELIADSTVHSYEFTRKSTSTAATTTTTTETSENEHNESDLFYYNHTTTAAFDTVEQCKGIWIVLRRNHFYSYIHIVCLSHRNCATHIPKERLSIDLEPSFSSLLYIDIIHNLTLTVADTLVCFYEGTLNIDTAYHL